MVNAFKQCLLVTLNCSQSLTIRVRLPRACHASHSSMMMMMVDKCVILQQLVLLVYYSFWLCLALLKLMLVTQSDFLTHLFDPTITTANQLVIVACGRS
jgi:hypothetical protein